MLKSILLYAGLAVASANVLAAPRSLILEQSEIRFLVKEMGVPVAGAFKRFDAAIDIDPANPERSSARMRIDIGSLSTGNDEADAVAVDTDWLDKAHASYAMFESTSIRALGGDDYEAKGTLSIRNRGRPITVRFKKVEESTGMALLTSEFTISRSEFGVGGGEWNQPGVVAEEVPVKVRLRLGSAVTKSDAHSSR
jgi:polyisoprenoid-binding protein YceI